jgi:hypothetical protein
VDHELMVKAVRANTDHDWVVLYVQRWLNAPLQRPDGLLERRDRGTPQGSAVAPILANLFMHYAFDAWMVREFPLIGFERYVDDAVVHCVSKKQALMLREAIGERLAEVGLRLHPDKTKSCIAMIGTAVVTGMSTRRLRSWGTNSGSARHGTSMESSSARFRPQSARMPRSASTVRFAVGGCIGTRTGLRASSRGGSIRLCGAGCSTTAGSTGRSCMRCAIASTPI